MYLEKTSSRSKNEKQQQTQPTYDTESGNRSRATLVGDECSHHCAIPAPSVIAYGEVFTYRKDIHLPLVFLTNNMALTLEKDLNNEERLNERANVKGLQKVNKVEVSHNETRETEKTKDTTPKTQECQKCGKFFVYYANRDRHQERCDIKTEQTHQEI